jgi:hypothetical protein
MRVYIDYGVELYEICKINQVNHFDCFKIRYCFLFRWQKCFEKSKRFISERSLMVAAQMLLVSHLYLVEAYFELELFFFGVVIDDRAIPNLRKVAAANKKVRGELMIIVSVLKLAVYLVSDNLGSFLNNLQVFVLDTAVLKQKLCLVLEIEELRQLHSLDLLQVVRLVLAETVGDELQLVHFVKNRQMLKSIEIGVQFVNCVNTFVHTQG